MQFKTLSRLIYVFTFFVLILISISLHAFEYRVGPGDVIQIDVHNESDLQMKTRIDSSGIITFPFLGELKVLGQTTKEMGFLIEKGLKGDYLINPQVIVSIVEYRPFYINGMVNRPGGYPYQEGLTLDKAIALSGGLASRASNTDWKISRVVSGKTITIDANISTAVKPDDIINIGQSFF